MPTQYGTLTDGPIKDLEKVHIGLRAIVYDCQTFILSYKERFEQLKLPNLKYVGLQDTIEVYKILAKKNNKDVNLHLEQQ